MAQIFTGTVLSNKMQNTVIIAVERKMRHPRYQKTITRTKKIKAHTDRVCQLGEVVKITSTRPLAKTVAFQVIDL